MLIILCLLTFVLKLSCVNCLNHDWDIAVAINDQIELLTENGTTITPPIAQFSKLKALTMDTFRQQLIFSDMNQENDTIFAIKFDEQADINPIIEDLPDDVQGLAIDQKTDTLYWSNPKNKTIQYVSLKGPNYEPNIFMEFNDTYPEGLAIDTCRRYIYFTNSNVNRPSIERVHLDKKEREILVETNLFMPLGITIDHRDQRIYWTDMRQGIYYRIESVNLNGKERKIIDDGTHQKPYGIAINDEKVFWTDVNNNALWAKYKDNLDDLPIKLKSFNEKPMGLVMKNYGNYNISDCQKLMKLINEEDNMTKEGSLQNEEHSNLINECLNDGVITKNGCKCVNGFSGTRCEISIYAYYCLNGSFYYDGTPKCKCFTGFTGLRCERDICDGFCLNNGYCERTKESKADVKCICPNGFYGTRCEKDSNYDHMCEFLCKTAASDVINNNGNVCRCNEENVKLNINKSKIQVESLQQTESPNNILQNINISYILIGIIAMLFIIIIVLSIKYHKSKRRPTIQKRIIVNKNIRPLTYRPQPPPDQCEITIENCCNMNVCETPCFEPPKFRNQKDEKKTLLSNMENSEDMY